MKIHLNTKNTFGRTSIWKKPWRNKAETFVLQFPGKKIIWGGFLFAFVSFARPIQSNMKTLYLRHLSYPEICLHNNNFPNPAGFGRCSLNSKLPYLQCTTAFNHSFWQSSEHASNTQEKTSPNNRHNGTCHSRNYTLYCCSSPTFKKPVLEGNKRQLWQASLWSRFVRASSKGTELWTLQIFLIRLFGGVVSRCSVY